MKVITTVLLMLFSLLSLPALATEQTDMKLILDKNGIKIWSYRIPNSPFHGFKAVTTVKSTLTGVVALIMDNESASRWLYRTNEVATLSQDHDNFVVRVVTNFPWPFKDREAIVEGKITQDPNNLFVRIDSASVMNHPVRAGYERMPKVEGGWLFRPIGHGQIEVTMTGHAELGGYVPAAIVNLLIQEHPFHSLSAFKDVVSEQRFQTAQLASIREPAYN